MIHDIAIYINRDKSNIRLIRLKFDSNLIYSVIYDRKLKNDSIEMLKTAPESLERLTH